MWRLKVADQLGFLLAILVSGNKRTCRNPAGLRKLLLPKKVAASWIACCPDCFQMERRSQNFPFCAIDELWLTASLLKVILARWITAKGTLIESLPHYLLASKSAQTRFVDAMDMKSQENQPVPVKSREIDDSLDLLSAIFERVDSLGSVSKAILYAFGKCVGNGIAKTYKPASLYLEGKARVAVAAHKIERIAKAQAEADLIRCQAKAKELEIGLDASETVLDRVRSRLVNKELFHQRNIEAIIAESIQIAEAESREETASEIDESWMWKFIEGAQGVSEAELRSLWARLLSHHTVLGNVKPAVLDALRLFDKEMAQDFRQVSILSALYEGFFPTLGEPPYYEYLNSADVTLERVDALVDSGVMVRSDYRTLDTYDVSFVFSIVAPPKNEEIIYIAPYFLNGVGIQLANILYGPIYYKHSIKHIMDRERLINEIGLERCSSYLRNMVWCLAMNNGSRCVDFQYAIEFGDMPYDMKKSPYLLLRLTDYYDRDSLVMHRDKQSTKCYWSDVATFLGTIKEQCDSAPHGGAEVSPQTKDVSSEGEKSMPAH